MRASRGTSSGPVPLDEDDDAIARGPGSIEDLRIGLVLTGFTARQGGDRARGVFLLPNGKWRAHVKRGAPCVNVLLLNFTSRAVAQEVRDATCTILGEGWVPGSLAADLLGLRCKAVMCSPWRAG